MLMRWLTLGLLLACGALAYLLNSEKREFAEYREQVAQQDKKAADNRARDLLIKVRNNERIAENDQKLQDQLRVELAAAQSAVERLRRDNDRAKQTRPVPTTTEARTLADEATTARDLLAECSGRYQEVDASAKSLGAQVIGLQAYANDVCLAGSGE